MKNKQAIELEEFSVVLPEKREFIVETTDIEIYPTKDIKESSDVFFQFHSDNYIKNKMIRVSIKIILLKDPKKSASRARDFLLASAPFLMKEGSFYNPRKPIGQGSWQGGEGSILCGYDGAFIYTISLSPSSYTNRAGERVRDPILPADSHLIENLATNMLHRATALGLTSIQKEKAPAWAKRQVEDRLARLKKSKKS
jgi:hypothetical protein